MTRRALGVTYVELLLVVTMLGILTALVLPTGMMIHRRAKERDLRRGLSMIRAAIDQFHRDWEKGCVEAEDEKGWPADLEQLRDGVEWSDAPECNPETPGSGENGAGTGTGTGTDRGTHVNRIGSLPGHDEDAPEKRVYLRHVPADPFNTRGEEWDTLGWKARSYDDEPDATSWRGDGLYDVYSSSEVASIDRRSKYSEW